MKEKLTFMDIITVIGFVYVLLLCMMTDQVAVF